MGVSVLSPPRIGKAGRVTLSKFRMRLMVTSQWHSKQRCWAQRFPHSLQVPYLKFEVNGQLMVGRAVVSSRLKGTVKGRVRGQWSPHCLLLITKSKVNGHLIRSVIHTRWFVKRLSYLHTSINKDSMQMMVTSW